MVQYISSSDKTTEWRCSPPPHTHSTTHHHHHPFTQIVRVWGWMGAKTNSIKTRVYSMSIKFINYRNQNMDFNLYTDNRQGRKCTYDQELFPLPKKSDSEDGGTCRHLKYGVFREHHPYFMCLWIYLHGKLKI